MDVPPNKQSIAKNANRIILPLAGLLEEYKKPGW